MQTTVLPDPAPEDARPPAPPATLAATPAVAPALDLSRMEPPRRLAEARLEDVTIDGICGVY